MSARYGGGHYKNSRIVRAREIDIERVNVPVDLESVDEACERVPERVARLNAAGIEAWAVDGWRLFVREGLAGRREIRTPSEFAALLGAPSGPDARHEEAHARA